MEQRVDDDFAQIVPVFLVDETVIRCRCILVVTRVQEGVVVQCIAVDFCIVEVFRSDLDEQDANFNGHGAPVGEYFVRGVFLYAFLEGGLSPGESVDQLARDDIPLLYDAH